MPSPAQYRVLADSDEIEALLWDWDGTLVQSAEINFQAFREAMAKYHLTVLRVWYEPRASMTTRELLVHWVDDHGPLPVEVTAITSLCRDYVIDHARDLVIVEPVAAIARLAHAAGWRQGIASNSSSAPLAAAMKATGLEPLFQVAVTSSDVTHGKPAPDVFLLAAQRLGVEPHQCLVYEDAPQGIIAAHAAGMRVIDVREGLAVPARLHAHCQRINP
jgi:HAD superfamily hydrolase (TIGR01509 family)